MWRKTQKIEGGTEFVGVVRLVRKKVAIRVVASASILNWDSYFCFN